MEKLYGYWIHLIKIPLKKNWLECILLHMYKILYFVDKYTG